MNENDLDSYIYELIYKACEDVEISLDSNKIDITPKDKIVQRATDDIIGYVQNYWEYNFITLCKRQGLRELCDHCSERFVCWTEK
jgi:hypothetical protein